MKKRIFALLLAVMLAMPFSMFSMFVEIGAETTESVAIPSEPVLTSTAKYYYCTAATKPAGSTMGDGSTPLTPLSSANWGSTTAYMGGAMRNGGTFVCVGKGYINGTVTIPATTSPVLFTAVDGDTVYYDATTMDNATLTGHGTQLGMLFANANNVVTFMGDVIFDDAFLLDRTSSKAKSSTFAVGSTGKMVICEGTIFDSMRSYGTNWTGGAVGSGEFIPHNIKASVAEGGYLYLHALGFQSYSGKGTIVVDRELFESGQATADTFAGFEGTVVLADGSPACEYMGDHRYTVKIVDGAAHYVCTECGHVGEKYEYTIPALENEDAYCYWAFTGVDANDGLNPTTPKKTIAAITNFLPSGGNVVITGKGYMSTSMTVGTGGTLRFTSIGPDGTSYVGVDYNGDTDAQFGSLLVGTASKDQTITYTSDVIFSDVIMYSRDESYKTTYKITNGATALFENTETRGYPTNNIILVDAGSTAIMKGDNVGVFGEIQGEGTVIIDRALLENGKITPYTFIHFDGTVLDFDYDPVEFLYGGEKYVHGDITADGALDNGDISLFVRYLAGQDIGIDECDRFDATADGKINNRDAIILIQRLAGVEGTFIPAARFAVFSDIHLQDSTNTDDRLKNMLLQLNKYGWNNSDGYSGLDAVCVVGDIADDGLIEQLEYAKELLEFGLCDETELVITIGNHDYWGPGTDAEALERFNSVFTDTVNAHKVINGYHFITVGVYPNYYREDTLAWLEGELAKAYEDTGEDKPIFVFEHIGPPGTCAGACEHEGTEEIAPLGEILSNYPNIINFSGHSHSPINNQFSVYQKDYTSVGTGSLWYGSRLGLGEDLLTPDNYQEISQCWIVEVDLSGCVRMRAFDSLQNRFVGEDILIDSYNKDDFKYTEGRYTSEDIFFSEDASLEIEHLSDKLIAINFPKNSPDSVFANFYMLEIADEDGNVVGTPTYISDDWWNEDYTKRYTLSVGGLSPETKYTARLYAANTQYCRYIDLADVLMSSPLTLDFTTPATPTEVRADVVELVINGENGNVSVTSDYESLSAEIVGSPLITKDDSIGMSVIDTDGTTANVVKISGFTDAVSKLKYGLTFETYFKVDAETTDSTSVISATEVGGFGLSVNGTDKKCSFQMYTGSKYVSAGFTYEVGRYYHVVATFDGAMLSVYVDGVLAESVSFVNAIHFNSPSTHNIYIGGDTTSKGACQYPTDVTVAMLKLYSRGLAASEVTALTVK